LQTSRLSAIKNILIVFLVILILVNVGVTFAYFVDRESSESSTLKFGTIVIEANNEDWFEDAQSQKGILLPGTTFLKNNVTFKLGQGNDGSASKAFYVRASFKVTTQSTNSEVLKVCNYFETNSLPTALDETLGYKWTYIDGYYYFVTTAGEPFAVNSEETTYKFLDKTTAVIPSSLEYDAMASNEDEITITITLQAIQTVNIVVGAGETLLENIVTELDAIYSV